jgi:hypothetical protein
MPVDNSNPTISLQKLEKLIPLLGSDRDGEVIAATRAVDRVLKVHKCDWHDLVSWIHIPHAGAPPTWQVIDDVSRRQWLHAAIDAGCFNIASRNFATDILRKRDFTWLSSKQIAWLDSFLAIAHRHCVRINPDD